MYFIYLNLSNSLNSSPDGLWVTDTFAKTHRMSTYLVAFAVTDFESRSEGNVSSLTKRAKRNPLSRELKAL